MMMDNQNNIEPDDELRIDGDDAIGDPDDFAEFDDSASGTLGDAWRNNPLLKISVILAGFATIVGGIILFGGSSPSLPPSHLPGGADVVEAPGTADVSETYQRAIEEFNIQATEEAYKTGDSVIPVPISPPVGRLDRPQQQPEAEDPLERWRRMQEERMRQESMQRQMPQAPEPQPDNRGPAIDALAKAMAAQMESILGQSQLQGPQLQTITTIDWLNAVEAEMREAALGRTPIATDDTGMQADLEVLIPAGEIVYAQLMIEANTDAPGPVVAQIVGGKLAGSRVIGGFNATDEFLVISFDKVVVDGLVQNTEAYALDPNTTLPGLITERDRRYWKRFVLPVAAEFIRGAASVMADSATRTDVTVTGGSTVVQQSATRASRDQKIAGGIEAAGNRFGQFMDEEAARTRPMLRVAAGTPVGILFVEPVTRSLR